MKGIEAASKLTIDCGQCSGLCCVALCYRKTDGFPSDKAAGKPCVNLMPDFHCAIHPQLHQLDMKGCLAYDCFGAGQRVTRVCYPDRNWMDDPDLAGEIFEVFLIMVQLHQMQWYLVQAIPLAGDQPLISELEALLLENEEMAARSPGEILKLDVESYRKKVNKALRTVCGLTGAGSSGKEGSRDYIGRDFRRSNLDGKDFSMSLLIAANLAGCSLGGTNFLGADLRDADIRNADLSKSLFLTQMQINSAIGDSRTMLPPYIHRPEGWAGNRLA